jgi:hypothetical protein
MKTLKMNLDNIQGKLSRNEMKNVVGGVDTGSTGDGGDVICICNNTDYGRIPAQMCVMLCSV